MAYQAQVQPELFALAGVGFFLALSLLTYLGQNRFPRKLTYIYQIAASLGLLCLVVSRFVLPKLEELVRFWYCYSFLISALVNVTATNIYLAVSKREHYISRMWSVTVTFPSVLIGSFLVAQYSLTQISIAPSIVQITIWSSAIATAIGISIPVCQRISHTLFRSAHREVTK